MSASEIVSVGPPPSLDELAHAYRAAWNADEPLELLRVLREIKHTLSAWCLSSVPPPADQVKQMKTPLTLDQAKELRAKLRRPPVSVENVFQVLEDLIVMLNGGPLDDEQPAERLS